MLSPYLLASIVLTVLGIALFVYGRKVGSIGVGIGGIVLLLVPYIAFSAWALWTVAAITVVAVVAMRAFAPAPQAR